MNKRLLVLAVLAIIIGISCSGDSSNHDHHSMEHNTQTEIVEVANVDPDSATVDMINRYKKCIAALNPEGISDYISENILNTIDEKIASAQGAQKVDFQTQKAIYLLRIGETESSIELLESILQQLAQMGAAKTPDSDYFVNKYLAIAYMRKGEQDNCLKNHNDESCIIPISKKAQHTLREGSEKTIEILNEILKQNSEDKEAQYLLNIAHMTLGSYPNAVPEAYRIPTSYFEGEKDFPKFKDVATGLGIGVSELSGGTCIEDFNNDGYLDIFASSWGFHHQLRYFENNRNGGFIEKTKATGLNGVFGGLNLRHADYNNDGHVDFIVLRGAWLESHGKIPNSLIRNNGDGTFTDVTVEAGVYALAPTQTAVWADFNLDGWVDMFIANESTPNELNKNELYINQKDGTFKNIIEESGLDISAFFKGVAVGDVNNDRYPDLYLSNYFGDNFLFINDGKEGEVHFSPSTVVSGLEKPTFSFSTWMFDYNNDGRDDIFVSGYSTNDLSPATLMMNYTQKKANNNRPHLFKNLGRGRFAEVSLKAGLDEAVTTMGCNFGDLNNDGFLDFYLASGNPNYYSIVPNKMYLNSAGKSFDDITFTSGFGHIQKGHAVGFGDLDMDGDQDVYTVMGGAYEGDVFSNLLFENPIGNKNNWINIRLVGSTSNKFAIGAKIILTIEEEGEERKVYHNVGYDASFGGNSFLAELGVGKAKKIKRLEILWPNAQKTETAFENVAVNQHIQIEEGQTEYTKIKVKKTPFVVNQNHHHHH